jgi:hypothetical protein
MFHLERKTAKLKKRKKSENNFNRTRSYFDLGTHTKSLNDFSHGNPSPFSKEKIKNTNI